MCLASATWPRASQILQTLLKTEDLRLQLALGQMKREYCCLPRLTPSRSPCAKNSRMAKSVQGRDVQWASMCSADADETNEAISASSVYMLFVQLLITVPVIK